MEIKHGIKMRVGYSASNDDIVTVPLIENYEAAIGGNAKRPGKMYRELKEKWESEAWGYYGYVEFIEHVRGLTYKDLVKCDEFDIWLFDEEAVKPDNVYSRPFENVPETLCFTSYFALDCYLGNVYSRDFQYYYCEGCQRYVCGQNPSNGWHSQVHILERGIECNRCYEERVLRDGINEDFNDDLPGQFFNDKDIEGAGWTCEHNNLFVDRKDYAVSLVKGLIDKGNKVLINYESVAIGGLEGTISIYVKS